MDFAKKQLEKFGWEEGQGLGRERNGIANPIKVKIKRDAGGVGLAPGEEFKHWWSDVFNKAAQNITVKSDDGGVVLERKVEDDIGLTLKARHYGNHRKSLLYRGFLDSTCTYNKGDSCAQSEDTSDNNDCAQCDDVSKTCSDDAAWKGLTDEELLKACGGRTAHKAARHGLKLNGKLKRIQEQEALQATSKSISGGSATDSSCSRKRRRTKDSSSAVKKRKS